jgi:hypothetical protein
MPEVKQVTVILANPSRLDPDDQVTSAITIDPLMTLSTFANAVCFWSDSDSSQLDSVALIADLL